MREQIKKKLLVELLRDSKRSDRELARVLDSSQPTITRALSFSGIPKEATENLRVFWIVHNPP